MKGLNIGINTEPVIEEKNHQLNDTKKAIHTIDRYLDELDGASMADCHAYRGVMQAFRQSVGLPEKYEKMGTISAFTEMRYELNLRADQIRDDINKCKQIQRSISDYASGRSRS